MRIVTVTNDYPPLIGGMAVHAKELSEALAEAGHQVTVLTGSLMLTTRLPMQLFDRIERVRGVDIVRLGAVGFLRSKQLVWRANSWLRRHSRDYDVIHVHQLAPLLKISRGVRAPLVFTNHSSMFLLQFDRPEERPGLARDLCRATYLTAPSRELVAKSVAVGFPEERTAYIPNGVDIGRFTPRKMDAIPDGLGFDRHFELGGSHIVVLCARRFVSKNGLHVYVDALEELARQGVNDNCVFAFVGNTRTDKSGSYACDIHSRLDALAERMCIVRAGAIPNERMCELWAVSDICVLPSLVEATSISGLEAMAAGLPIVGTNVGGIPEIVRDGETGILCPPNDAMQFAKALGRMISDRDLAARMGRAARELAKKEFSWQTIAGRFAEAYERAMLFARKSV